MIPSELEKLVALGESTTLDFKRDLREDSFREFSKDLAAFSNAGGGMILVGVGDNKEILGVDWEPEKSARVQQEGAKCSPKIQPTITKVSVPRKGTVVVIEIPKSSFLHQDGSQRYPLRVGDSTVPMDTALILAVARNKGLLGIEQQGPYSSVVPLLNAPYIAEPRQKPTKIAFLADSLVETDPFVRVEALKDLQGNSYQYAVEEIAGIDDRLFGLLDNEDSSVRLQTLQLFGTLSPHITKDRRGKLQARLGAKAEELVFQDKDAAVRNAAMNLLCQIGAANAISVIIRLIKTEPEPSFTQLGLQNGFRYLVDVGMGIELRKKLSEELRAAQSTDLRARITRLIEMLRNWRWAN